MSSKPEDEDIEPKIDDDAEEEGGVAIEESEAESDNDISDAESDAADVLSVDEDEEDLGSNIDETELQAETLGIPRFNDMDDLESDDEKEEDDNYLQKFDEEMTKNLIVDHHPELHSYNYDEIDILSRVVRDENGVIIDPLHRTLPFITRYEKARILGERAKQLNAGARPFVEVDVSVIDGYLIAMKEYDEKKIPFFVRRPLPNGGVEVWRFSDLELL